VKPKQLHKYTDYFVNKLNCTHQQPNTAIYTKPLTLLIMTNALYERLSSYTTTIRVQTPGYVPKKTRVHPRKKCTPKTPHFYFNLILVYTLYATNNAIFYCFKPLKALSY